MGGNEKGKAKSPIYYHDINNSFIPLIFMSLRTQQFSFSFSFSLLPSSLFSYILSFFIVLPLMTTGNILFPFLYSYPFPHVRNDPLIPFYNYIAAPVGNLRLVAF